MKRSLVLSALALAALLPGAAAAQTAATSTLTVSANVVGYCTIDPAELAFGAYDPASTGALDASAPLAINCTQGSSFWVEFGPAGARRMVSAGGDTLDYELYRDAARTAVWDDADPLTRTPAGTPVTVYGRVTAGQLVPVGDYEDSVTMTVHL